MGKKIIVACKVCGTEKEYYKSRLNFWFKNGQKNIFCSKRCVGIGTSDYLTPKQRQERSLKMVTARWKNHVGIIRPRRDNEDRKIYMRKYSREYRRKFRQTYKDKYPNGPTDKKRFTNRRYKARKRNAKGSHTFEEWLILKLKYKNMCLCCKKQEPEIKLTEDHIMPLSMEGTDYIDNVQPLCVSCNVRKHSKHISYLPEENSSFVLLN